MNIIRAVCRIEKATKKPAIFYWNSDGIVDWMECYTFSEQHGEVAWKYYRHSTRLPINKEEEEAITRLIKHYALICSRHREMLVIGKRLTRK